MSQHPFDHQTTAPLDTAGTEQVSALSTQGKAETLLTAARDKVDHGLRTYNYVIDGKRRTSVRLEPCFKKALDDIAEREGLDANALCTMIFDRNKRKEYTFTTAIRLFIFSYYRISATEEGHRLAGHGQSQPFNGTPFDEGPSARAASPAARKNMKRKLTPGRTERRKPRAPAHNPTPVSAGSDGEEN
ncbi:MAG: ribbon-helix-helix domain-containing protein [Rhodospirillaceae bacterium]